MGFFTKTLSSVIKTFSKLSRPMFTFDENILKFKIDSEHFYEYELDDFETKTRHDSYVLEAYTLKTSSLHLEHINVDMDVSWRGAASSLYKSLMQTKMQIKKLELLEEMEYEHFSFSTYAINDSYILNLIHVWEIDKDTFILDFQGNLYEELRKSFDSTYKYTFPRNHLTKPINTNFSLVKENAFQEYFTMEKE